MENNQHSKQETEAPNRSATPFSNEQPGQQLPADKKTNDVNKVSSGKQEQHSESSLPEAENETLGTP